METFNSTCETEALSTQAVNVCGPIFSPPTIRCVTKNFDIMQLFTDCITAVCSKSKATCILIDNDLKQAKCAVPTITAACPTL